MSTRRAWLWNLAALLVQGAALVWAHALGAAWSTLAAVLGVVLAAGAAALAVTVRRTLGTPGRRRAVRAWGDPALHAVRAAQHARWAAEHVETRAATPAATRMPAAITSTERRDAA